jgi:glycyl-tRNA synthetase beta chain
VQARAKSSSARRTSRRKLPRVASLERELDVAREKSDWAKAFAGIAAFAPTLHRYFEDVFVMDPDENVRSNRLRLMRAISERCSRIAHFQLLG